MRCKQPFKKSISKACWPTLRSNSAIRPSAQRCFPLPGNALPGPVRNSRRQRCSTFGLTSNARAASPMETPCSSRRSEEHTSELQSQSNLVCRLLLEKTKRRVKNALIDTVHTTVGDFTADDYVLCSGSWSPLVARDLRLALPIQFFFFNDTATTEIYTLSLHDALPI